MPELHPDTRGAYNVEKVAQAAAATPGISRVFVYGSAAWGGWEPGVSDLDLMVEGADESADELARVLAQVAPGTLDIRLEAELTWHHLADIRARGILIYDRSRTENTAGV